MPMYTDYRWPCMSCGWPCISCGWPVCPVDIMRLAVLRGVCQLSGQLDETGCVEECKSGHLYETDCVEECMSGQLCETGPVEE